MTTSRDKQVNLLERALSLARAHPDYEIRVCTPFDELCPEFGWTNHHLGSVAIEWWYDTGEGFVIGLDKIKDQIEIAEDRRPSDDEARAVSRQVIVIYTEP